jgi:large subunit ribosomal protein L9
MKVVLLKDVKGIGQRFDVKNVSSGYAMNFLIPQGLAVIGTDEAIKRAEIEKKKHIAERKLKEDLLLKNINSLKDAIVKIEIESGKVNEKGHLFSAIHKDKIVSAIKDQTRLDILSDLLHIDQPIKELGEHKIPVKVGEQEVVFTLVVELKKN